MLEAAIESEQIGNRTLAKALIADTPVSSMANVNLSRLNFQSERTPLMERHKKMSNKLRQLLGDDLVSLWVTTLVIRVKSFDLASIIQERGKDQE